MASPTLTQVFGSNANQDASTLTISKIDLAIVGLTASSTNTAESLLVALILLMSAYLSPTNQSANPDIRITFEETSDSPQIVQRNGLPYRQVTYNANLQTQDTGFSIDPNSY